MKKLVVFALAGLIAVSTALAFPAAPDLNRQTDCNRNHQDCREYTLNLDEPWYKVMVLLTACDVAFGKCMLGSLRGTRDGAPGSGGPVDRKAGKG